MIAAEQAEKARHLGPGAPTHAEQIVTKVRDTFLQPRDGLYPYIDSVYGGGGFTLGAGFLRYYGDRSTVGPARAVLRQELQACRSDHDVSRATCAGGWRSMRAAGWRDATRVGYYGLGIETDADARANYRFKESYVGGYRHASPGALGRARRRRRLRGIPSRARPGLRAPVD